MRGRSRFWAEREPKAPGWRIAWRRLGTHPHRSREAARAQETARLLRERIGGGAQIEGLDNPSAAAACDVAVLTVPFSGVVALLKQLKSVWKPGTIVIDTTVPLAATIGRRSDARARVWQGSRLNRRESFAGGREFAAAFQNLGAETLAGDAPVDCRRAGVQR